MSTQAIRAWLAAAGPEAAAALMRENPGLYLLPADRGARPDRGPVGTLGVPLLPGRSLAVDPAQVPLGAPLWIAARDPLDGRPIHRLVLAQDTGGAIRGRARGDLFWGWDEVPPRRGRADAGPRGAVLPAAAAPATPERAQPGAAQAAGSAGSGPTLD